VLSRQGGRFCETGSTKMNTIKEHIHKNGLEKAIIEAFAEFFLRLFRIYGYAHGYACQWLWFSFFY
jgi:hypothetical protein